ncbi:MULTISPECIES: cobalt transporter CbiM [unclassified Roseofilum]|uniref:cobalt transporter CbiM n=1 Tax=unclassified Roseofilum TaxID=2620099 RepID=UPI001B1DBFF6|nr:MULTISPECIES: cobalt transporter CbiM [unclassified Roseofilum]MBP0009791.1 cobalt transporter CbiM [Roseofilum sp. Belize Diploria]MBP0034241.1 cobalt transporter CbiM [Roseofilum sp. Belize BBD 4]MBP0041702.1 cobalt transporter CbiM [Roseofilum sp. SBFL]
MHIPDGMLPPQVVIVGYAVSGGVMAWSLKQIERSDRTQEQIPKASLLTAAFFVSSSFHIPIPPASVHLVLNGLLGAILGYYAFPAIVIGLFFQTVMFQHGGLSTLGVNALLMGIPALLAGYLFRSRFIFGFKNRFWTLFFGFLSGSSAVALSATIFLSLVLFTLPTDIDQNLEQASLWALLFAHIPLVILEGLFTAMVVIFLEQVKPELINH